MKKSIILTIIIIFLYSCWQKTPIVCPEWNNSPACQEKYPEHSVKKGYID
jgi:hypothetical protein